MTTTWQQIPVRGGCEVCRRDESLTIEVAWRYADRHGVRYSKRRECLIRRDCTEACLHRLAAMVAA
jgi:hypothetical protein